MKLGSDEDIDFGLGTATTDRLGLVPYADRVADGSAVLSAKLTRRDVAGPRIGWGTLAAVRMGGGH
jgi:hypothetical protein